MDTKMDRREFLRALVIGAVVPGALIPAGEDGDWVTFQVRKVGLRGVQVRDVPPTLVWKTDGVTMDQSVEPAMVLVQFFVDPAEFQSIVDQLQGTPPDRGLKAVQAVTPAEQAGT